MTLIEIKREIAQLKALQRKRIQLLREFGQIDACDDSMLHQVMIVADSHDLLMFQKEELRKIEQNVFKIGNIE